MFIQSFAHDQHLDRGNGLHLPQIAPKFVGHDTVLALLNLIRLFACFARTLSQLVQNDRLNIIKVIEHD